MGVGGFEPSLEDGRMWPQGGLGTQSSGPGTVCARALRRGGDMERIETIPVFRLVHSCAEKLQSDEQFSKNLFGPPLESAFDHEDFTGDGGGDFGATGLASEMGGSIARAGLAGDRLEGALGGPV